VLAIIDSRGDAETPWRGKAIVMHGAYVSDAHGGKSLNSIDIWRDGREEKLEVDSLGMSGGFSPVIHLAGHRGGKPVWSDEHSAFLAPSGIKGLVVAGSAVGIHRIAAALQSSSSATQALGALSICGIASSAPQVDDDYSLASAPLFTVPGVTTKAFVDYQNDVARSDLDLAVREGYGHVELAKRYTTNGMATDQGKLSNVNAIGLIAEARRISPGAVGTTTFRPFYTPVSFGAPAGASHGKHFQPVRKSPLHACAQKSGAVFVETELWYRSSRSLAPAIKPSATTSTAKCSILAPMPEFAPQIKKTTAP